MDFSRKPFPRRQGFLSSWWTTIDQSLLETATRGGDGVRLGERISSAKPVDGCEVQWAQTWLMRTLARSDQSGEVPELPEHETLLRANQSRCLLTLREALEAKVQAAQFQPQSTPVAS